MDGKTIVDKMRKGRQTATPPADSPAPASRPAARASAGGKAKQPVYYYDQARGRFWASSEAGEWQEYTEAQFSRLLRYHGIRKDLQEGYITQLEHELLKIQREQSCHFAGELAGFTTGLHDICGFRVFVTRGPRIPKPAQGAWPTLRKYFSELLGDDVRYFHGWLKSAFLSLKAGPPFRPGQALGIAGQTNCGKSLLQGLITEMLGGRSGLPYKFLIDKTEFNRDLFRAEHLQIEDSVASTDIRARRAFAAALKGLVANETQAYHPKGKDAIILTPFWRISITVNDDAEHLMVLPPLDTSLKDKLILLRAHPATFPFTDDDLEPRRRFRQTLTREIPAYLYWLKNWPIPEDIRSVRYGVIGYQQPQLAQALTQLEPEHKLWTLIQSLGVVTPGWGGWRGTSTKLELLLREKDRAGEVARICYYNTACGNYLEKLSRHMPDLVKKVSSNDHRGAVWHICIPPDED